jgi:hypothetical protein
MERGLGVRSHEGVYPTHRATALTPMAEGPDAAAVLVALHAVCSRVIAAQTEATYRAAVEQGRALRPDGP